MHELTVGASTRLYVGHGLLSDTELLGEMLSGTPSALLVCGQGVPEALSEPCWQTLQTLPLRSEKMTLTDDESGKNIAALNDIFDPLLDSGHGRDTCLLALGGGVTGDMTGFAAACYQRGVRWLNLPTTLLAQADACIGGKTGVNHALGKNMIGAFHAPSHVLADVTALSSLPQRQLSAGLAEIIKHALIADDTLLDWLENNLDALLKCCPDALEEAVFRSCQIKAAIVTRDEKEQGERALLNFGHSFAHAMETWLNYRDLLHGEAVAIGMVMAASLSQQLHGLEKTAVERISSVIARSKLPTRAPAGMSADDFLRLMRRDKKVLSGAMRLVLLPRIGQAELVEMADENELSSLLRDSAQG